MREAGCTSIYFGIETGSARMQQVIKKRLDIAPVLPTVRRAVDLGMNGTLSFICGYPDETERDLNDTLTMIMDAVSAFGSEVNVQLHVLAPYLGTELYSSQADHLQFDGYLSDQAGQALNDEDECLIKAYPTLFSNFYSVPTRWYDRRLLFGIDAFVYVLVRDFPLTLLVLREFAGDALTVFLTWQRCVLERSSPRDIAVVGGSLQVMHEGLRTLISRYVDANDDRGRLLSGVFAYEAAVAAQFTRSAEPAPAVGSNRGTPPPFSSISLVRSSVDIASLRRTIAAGCGLAELRIDQQHHMVLVRKDPGRVDVHSVSPFLARILERHHARERRDDILRALQSDYPDQPPERIAAAIEEAYKAASQSGLLDL
jgi:hypothetical protein